MSKEEKKGHDNIPVGLFAGAFSPVHEAHISRVVDSINLEIVQRVIVVPSSDAYRKPGLMPGSRRILLLEEAFRGMNNVTISQIDLNKHYFPDPMETAAEVEKAILSENEKLLWIMGGDRLNWIANNANLASMVEKYPFIVFDRPPDIKGRLLEIPIINAVKDQIIFLPSKAPNISSTDLRSKNLNE